MADTFETNLEKMVDLLKAVIAEDNMDAYDKFLRIHDDVTENELDDTIKTINANTLADLYRQAKSYHIEELNNKPTRLTIISSIAKDVIKNYVYNSGMLSIPQRKEFEKLCTNIVY